MQKTNNRFLIPGLLGAIALCTLCVCCGGIFLYFYGDTLVSQTVSPSPTDSNVPANPTPQTSVDPSSVAEWTVIVYSAADDEVLEETMWFDVNEMELVGSNPQLNIVVQIDRYGGAFDGDGDWTDARRYLVTKDNDLSTISSPIVQSLGEVDTGDPQTLIDFVTWAVQNYPAKKYALVMSDHGGGWTGGFSDMTSPNSDLSMPEIVSSIETIRQNTGIDKFEVIGFDACLMGQIEIFGSLYPYSNYMVASEEVIPGYGWSYAAWLEQVAQNPTMDGSGLSSAVVSTYVVNDVLLTDELRASADEIAQEESTTTLSAIESARVPDVIGAMNQLIDAMATLDQTIVAEARTYARSYFSMFGEEVSPSFIDLGNFSEVLANLTDDTSAQHAAVQLQSAIHAAVVAEKHGSDVSGSNGIAFHFPDSDLYYLTEYNSNLPTYADSSQKFLEQSSWDEFLAYHYTGEEFVPQEGQAITPSRTAEIVAPGASELTIGPIQISDTEISGDETVTVSTTVEGHVAFIHTALYFWDPTTESYWIADVSYYIAENTISVDGVNSPDYGESPIQVEYEWSPSLYTLTDGTHEAFALFEPAEYLSAEGQTVYYVYGQYTDALSNTPVDAGLYFDADGNFLYAYAFPDHDNDGASNPVEITPQVGDQFTDYIQYYEYDANNNPIYDYLLSDDVFTWGEQGFSFFPSYPADGQYAVGIIAYDFDNNFVANFEFINYTR
ncbi:MAG TPA: clostripain-related cysteine peptidase [Anaerolineales bacterium]|nr:clostripain-related cysteine peptidase [Anaerolineales bacterium]